METSANVVCTTGLVSVQLCHIHCSHSTSWSALSSQYSKWQWQSGRMYIHIGSLPNAALHPTADSRGLEVRVSGNTSIAALPSSVPPLILCLKPALSAQVLVTPEDRQISCITGSPFPLLSLSKKISDFWPAQLFLRSSNPTQWLSQLWAGTERFWEAVGLGRGISFPEVWLFKGVEKMTKLVHHSWPTIRSLF